MKNKSIVVNTSPWIALSICGKVSLLKELYSEAYLPVGVKDEIMEGAKKGPGIEELKICKWLKIGKIKDAEKINFLYELSRGEAEVMILAKERNIRQVLIDEKVARLQAKILGLEVIGTLGLLLKAKKLKVISSVKPLVEKMVQGGIWIDKDLIKGILREAGEKK